MGTSLFADALGLGLSGLALYAFIEKLLPVLPSFPFLIFVGMFGAGRPGDVGVSLFAITLGSTLGATALFLVARRIDEQRLRALAARFGRYLFLSVDRYDGLILGYRRRHMQLVFLGQLIPGARNVTPISAGTARVGTVPFVVATLASGMLWNASFLLFGYMLSGTHWSQGHDTFSPYAELLTWMPTVGTRRGGPHLAPMNEWQK